MTTKRTWERKRNQYVGNCKVCGVECPPGTSWLYSDTSSSGSRSRRRSSGRWLKFVKCDRCHTLGVSRKSQLPENQPAPRPKVTVDEIRSGRFVCCVERQGAWDRPLVRLVLADGTSEVAAYEEPITGDCLPHRCVDKWDAENLFGGRQLTPAARKELDLLSFYAAEMLEWFQVDYGRHGEGE